MEDSYISEEVKRDEMISFIFSKYPSGIMNGRPIFQMPTTQIYAIYNRLKSMKPCINGQISLFDPV